MKQNPNRNPYPLGIHAQREDPRPHLVFSCHADTGFRTHRLMRSGENLTGHLDNFVGVYALMTAYFSGRMDTDRVRIELTYGEETDMMGAYAVRRTLMSHDWVIVVDVTGIVTDRDITIEKCRSPAMRRFVETALQGMSYVLFEDCPDPIANEDESDVYSKRLENVFFLGIPCTGGDYNEGAVTCREASIRAAAEAILRFIELFTHDG